MKKTLFALLACAAVMPAMAANWEFVSAYFNPYKKDGVLFTDYTKYSFYVMVQESTDITSVKTMLADKTFSEFTSSGYDCFSTVKYHEPWKQIFSEEFKQTTIPTTISASDIWGVSVYQDEDGVSFQVVPIWRTNDLGTQFQFDTDWVKGSGYTTFAPAISIDEILKSATETRTNVAALVNSAADFMATTGVQQAKMAAKTAALAGKEGAAPFVAMGGSSMRYNTGSHVDADGFNGALGVAKTFGATTLGLAGEYGISSYKSYVGSTSAKGNSKLYGAALLADWQDKQGWHAEGAVRLGRTSTDYSAMTALGHKHYSDHASYQGIMLGGGKEIKVSRKCDDTVDLYARYMYSHTNGSNTTATSGEAMHFSAVDSHRTMVGARYNHELSDSAVVYAGAAWMHEFNGDAHSVIGGFTSPSPSLKGDSGMVEIGTTFAPCESDRVLINLNVQGWTGVQRGISGGAGCTIKF